MLKFDQGATPNFQRAAMINVFVGGRSFACKTNEGTSHWYGGCLTCFDA